jgi:hypothetical protein
MATNSWSLASSNFWDASSAWTLGVAPAAGDDAFITVTGATYTVDLITATAVLDSLTINSANSATLLVEASGILNVTGTGPGATDKLAIDSGRVEMTGGSITATGGITVGSNSILFGAGTVLGALSGEGTVSASNGILEVESNISGPTAMQFEIGRGNSVLMLDGSVLSGNTFTFSPFQAGVTQALVYNNALPLNTTIVGLDVGSDPTTASTNFVDFRLQPDLVVTSGGKHSTPAGAVTLSDGSILTLYGIANRPSTWFVNTASDGAGGTEVFLTLCFTAGTNIATPQGEVPVEQLAVGDQVLTASGAWRPIEWIGVGLVLATRGRRTAATPVIIRKGALADNVPHHDLRITKGHSLLIDGALIPVEFLVNHRSILWDDRAQEVSIYHLELATHDVLLADGAPAESYRDDGNRWLFRNANPGWHLPPQEPCAPVLTGGPVVDAVWRRLLDRAGPRPRMPLTGDADLHLVVDGQRCDAVSMSDGRAVFHLPGVPTSVRIGSRSGAPQEFGLSRDPRPLGIGLRRIVVTQGDETRVLEADDDRLADGFHDFEPDNGWRWTDGDAAVPAALFAGLTGPLECVLNLGGTTCYLDEGEALRVA